MTQWWLVVAGLLIILATWLVPGMEEKLVFLDVGQGDSILLQSGTQQVLIDGGPDATVLQRLGVEMPQFDRTIEVVMATHPDKDHIAGLVHVLERYEVELVILPEISHTSQLQSAWLDHIREALDRRQTQYRFANAGQSLKLANLDLTILHPERGDVFGRKTNNASVSVRGDFYELSFLLTGDAEAPIERQLVEKFSPPARGGEGGGGSILDVDILKAGHHGSKTSTSQALLDVTTPKTVVVSAGRDNQYGHPHPDIIERLKNYKLWRTDEQGTVRFFYEQGQWLVATNRH